MEKFTVQLRLTGKGTFGSVAIETPLEAVTVEGTGHTFVDAVNNAVHKLSNLLSRREA